jgi:hypothetical protein
VVLPLLGMPHFLGSLNRDLFFHPLCLLTFVTATAQTKAAGEKTATIVDAETSAKPVNHPEIPGACTKANSVTLLMKIALVAMAATPVNGAPTPPPNI